MVEDPRVGHPRRGEVYPVTFDPTVGAEIRKTRPAVVIQNDVGNRFSPCTIVAAVSSQFGPRLYPTEVFVPAGEGGLRADSVVLLDQIRTVDKRRLGRCLGRLKPRTMIGFDLALQVSLGLVDL